MSINHYSMPIKRSPFYWRVRLIWMFFQRDLTGLLLESRNVIIINISIIDISSIIPGHPFVLQEVISVLDPTQFWPPLAGAGLVHVLDRAWPPPPHVTEQDPHELQEDHWPSTKKNWTRYSKRIIKTTHNNGNRPDESKQTWTSRSSGELKISTFNNCSFKKCICIFQHYYYLIFCTHLVPAHT